MTAKEEHLKQVIVCDINPDMLQVGRYRAPKILGEKDSSMVRLSIHYVMHKCSVQSSILNHSMISSYHWKTS